MQSTYNDTYRDFDSRPLLRAYIPWIAKTFELGDLFVTINLKGIRHINSFVKGKLEAIERKVFLRRPNQMYRFPVLNCDQDWPHVHMLLKNVEYKSFWNNSFSSLVSEMFRKDLNKAGSVNIKQIDHNINAVATYSLLKQGYEVRVLFDALKMPSSIAMESAAVQL